MPVIFLAPITCRLLVIQANIRTEGGRLRTASSQYDRIVGHSLVRYTPVGRVSTELLKMDGEYIVALVDLLEHRHGEQAENIARKRSARCRRMKQADWAETWMKVATELQQRNARTTSLYSRSEGSPPR